MAGPLLPRALALLALLGALLTLPAAAGAAESYSAQAAPGCADTFASGQRGADGIVYIGCGWSLRRYTADGAALPDISLPVAVADIAPAAGGDYLYTFSGGALIRLERQADGRYRVDSGWRAASFTYEGGQFSPRGIYLATDSFGRIYVSNGSWAPGQPNKVLVYRPDGSLLTSFGDWGRETGKFYVNMGIAVTADGSSIYVTENSASRVQRFDRAVNGTYAFAVTWGQTDTSCAGSGTFGSPYDLSLDPWGDVYVLDATCARVQKFSPAGVVKASVVLAPASADLHPHGITVDSRGNGYVPQISSRFSRAVADTRPVPVAPAPPAGTDFARPTVTSFSAGLPQAGDVPLSLAATDNVGVSAVRLAGTDGVWGAWRAPAGSFSYSPGEGAHTIYAQAKDAAGNLSAPAKVDVVVPPAAPVAATPPASVEPPATPPAPTPVTSVKVTRMLLTTAGKSRTVTLRLTAPGAVAMRLKIDGVWTPWRKYTRTTALKAATGRTTMRVAVQVMDAAGAISRSASASVKMVSTPKKAARRAPAARAR